MREFFARTDTYKEWQKLKDHLKNVAVLCSQNCCESDKKLGYLIGILHDLGKYLIDFQEKMLGKNIRVDHSTFGAKIIMEKFPKNILSQIIAYVVASHHTGLIEGGAMVDLDNGTLAARLKKQIEITEIDEDIEEHLSSIFEEYSHSQENDISGLTEQVYYESEHDFILRFSTKIRMLLSALIDADWLDAETYAMGKQNRGYDVSFRNLLEKLEVRLSEYRADTDINAARKEFSDSALLHVKSENSLFKFDMPCGSGKTLASMRFALRRLLEKNRKRIIYVLPYTSIIDQNAGEFKKIFGEDIVIEHHSAFENKKGEEDFEALKKYRYAIENWDAPIIVTTNLQFFQSFFSDKASQIRKLHNMADSIICFDEIQSIPINCLQSCYDAIEVLAKDYNCDIIFMTATMPASNDYVKILDRAQDVIDDKSKYSLFERCNIIFCGEMTLNEFCNNIDASKSNLIVTNTRAQANTIHNNITAGKKYYLSTRLIPLDRKRIIKEITEDLKNELPITVVSTSLVEAGVDFDFEYVYRWINGADSILQCAGRCNREGRRKYGQTTVFWLSDVKDSKNSEVMAKIQFSKNLFKKYNNIGSCDAISEYFRQFYQNRRDTIEELSVSSKKYFAKTKIRIKDSLIPFYSVAFEKFAEDFQYIDKNTYDLVVLNNKSEKILGDYELNPGIKNKRLLQNYTLSLYEQELVKLLNLGCATRRKSGVYCLYDGKYYDKNLGLVFDFGDSQDNYTII